MSQCEKCGATFYSTSASWGDRTCGDCLANQIEASLMRRALGEEQRKPMRRTTTAQAQEAGQASLVEAARRSA